MRRWNVATGLLSIGLIVSACSSSSDTTGTGGSGGGAGHTGGTGGTSHTGGASGGGGANHTGGVGGGAAGTGGAAGAGVATGAGGAAGGAGATGTGGAAGGGGTSNGGHAGGGSSGGGTAGGAAGSAGGAAGGAGGAAGGAAGSAGGAAGGAVLTTQQMRGQYLVNSVLGCAGCHTPQGGAQLSGVDCFVKTAPTTTGTAGVGGNGAAGAGGGNGGAGGAGVTPCLSSANLTNDDTGLKKLTDQQIKDAFTKGMDPDDAGKFLFATMPYYQFGTLSSVDADAIVAYLRTVPAASHAVHANTAPYDVQPSAPEWAAVDPTALPNAGSAAGPTNGKYLATLVCATCHTVTVSSANPLHIDATKAFQGGKLVNTTVNSVAKTVQTSNLTPDLTGIMGYNATQVATAITTAKDKNSATICGMRALPNMTTSDATDIGTYLLGIPAVANTITMTCQ